MDRTERFYKIERSSCSRGSASALRAMPRWRSHLPHSSATCSTCATAWGRPIEYDAGSNGYRFGQQWRGAAHELPGVWFNEAELRRPLTMQHMLAGLDDDGGGWAAICSPCSTRSPACWAWTPTRRAADAACEAHCHGEAAPAKAIASRPWAVPSCNASDCTYLLPQAWQQGSGRARGLAPAPGAPPQCLVPGRLVPRERGPGALPRRRRDGRAARPGRRPSRSRPWRPSWTAAYGILPAARRSRPSCSSPPKPPPTWLARNGTAPAERLAGPMAAGA